MSELADLIARVEKLEGPDRAVDANLWAVLHGYSVTHDERTNLIWADKGVERIPLGHIDPGKHSRNFTPRGKDPYPAYTASLDAALALVERALPGWVVRSDIYPDRAVMSVEEPVKDGVWAAAAASQGEAPTPALALILTLLRALEASAEGERSRAELEPSLTSLKEERDAAIRLLKLWLEAFETGRSEPLYIARDATRALSSLYDKLK